MRKVDRKRVGEPTGLAKRRPGELKQAALHYASPSVSESFTFAAYKDESVKAALEKLFHGKCAYCESPFSSVHPVDVEHYRPKAKLAGTAGHRGYWWLAASWENLLPSCIDCNRRRSQNTPKAAATGSVVALHSGGFSRSRSISSGKGTLFPLGNPATRANSPTGNTDAEVRLLIDPTRDDPAEHIEFYVNRGNLISLVLARATATGAAAALPEAEDEIEKIVKAASSAGVSAIGAVSIQVYGLNRLSLVQARTRVLRDLEFLMELAINLRQISLELSTRADAREQLALSEGNMLRVEELKRDVAQDRGISHKLAFYSNEALSRIRAASMPSAPYSQLVRTWIEKVLRPEQRQAGQSGP